MRHKILSNSRFLLKGPMSVYKDLAKDRFFQAVEKLRKNTKGIDPEKLDAAIAEAVKSAQRTTVRKRKAKPDA